jgi:hypothetical protein
MLGSGQQRSLFPGCPVRCPGLFRLTSPDVGASTRRAVAIEQREDCGGARGQRRSGEAS